MTDAAPQGRYLQFKAKRHSSRLVCFMQCEQALCLHDGCERTPPPAPRAPAPHLVTRGARREARRAAVRVQPVQYVLRHHRGSTWRARADGETSETSDRRSERRKDTRITRVASRRGSTRGCRGSDLTRARRDVG